MNRRPRWCARLALAFLLLYPVFAPAVEPGVVSLPTPQLDRGKLLMQALQERKSTRAFAARKLSEQVLSNLLWAAFGVSRPGSGGRTAPSARNWQEIDIYVATEEGLYRYDAVTHALRQVLSEDIRGLTGRQAFVKDAPVNLVYVADASKTGGAPAAEREFYFAADAGFISQNVYLFCASEGLATVVRGLIDRPALATAMKLRPEQSVVLAQSVGYPKE
jgi:SagB-type dehydrogenase family enzyme